MQIYGSVGIGWQLSNKANDNGTTPTTAPTATIATTGTTTVTTIVEAATCEQAVVVATNGGIKWQNSVQ